MTHGPQPDIRGRLEGESRGNWGQQDQGSQMDRCRGGAAEGQDSETGTVLLTCDYPRRVLGGSRGGGWRQPMGAVGLGQGLRTRPHAPGGERGCRIWGRGREKKLSLSLASCPTRPAARPQETREEVPLPPPTSGPPAPSEPRDYISRQALRSRCRSFIAPALRGLLGVEVLNASPGCREDGNFFGGGGGVGVMRCRGPRALQGTGMKSGTSRGCRVLSP